MSEDTISRKAAIEALKEAFNPSITNFVKAKIAIDKLPSAQPEIIRCRDCAKCQYDTLFDQYWCNGREVREDFYCGEMAERRTDEGD